MYDFAMHSEKQEKLSESLKLVENSIRLLKASQMENSLKLQGEKQPMKKEESLTE